MHINVAFLLFILTFKINTEHPYVQPDNGTTLLSLVEIFDYIMRIMGISLTNPRVPTKVRVDCLRLLIFMYCNKIQHRA